MTRRFQPRRRERGSAAVEFALVCVALIPLIFGIIQYGWYFYVSSTTSHAAGTLARRLEVGDCWGAGEASAFASNASPMVTSVAVNPSSLSGATIGTTQVTVTVTTDAAIINFLPMPNGGIVTRSVTAQLEDDQVGAPCP